MASDRFTPSRAALLERTRAGLREVFRPPEWPPLPWEEGLRASQLDELQLLPRVLCRECGAQPALRVTGRLVLAARIFSPRTVIVSVTCPNRRCLAVVDVDAAAVARARKVAPGGRRG